MTRSDSYRCSSYWRNSNVIDSDRSNFVTRLKLYGVFFPVFFFTILSPSGTDISSARIPETSFYTEKRVTLESFHNERKVTLEERVNKVFNGFSQYNVLPYVNEKVEELLSSEGSKKELGRILSKLSFYEDYIVEASKETGLGVDFIKAYIAQESRGDYDAVSSRGATGLGGMRKLAAMEEKLRVDDHVDERLSPKSISASARYMKRCIEFFDDPIIGKIAYNVGPTWVSENINDIRTVYDLMKNTKIPIQSRNYVVEVLARTKIFSNPDAYQLIVNKVPLLSEMIQDIHITNSDITLINLASQYNISLNDLKRVNPSLKSEIVPKGVQVNIPRS